MQHTSNGGGRTSDKFACATPHIHPFPLLQMLRTVGGNLVFVFLILLPAAAPGPIVRADASPAVRSGISTPVPDDLTCTLPAPNSFDGERTSATTAFLEWSPVSGAAAYRLWVYDKNTLELVGETTEYGSSKNLTGLEPNVSYRCVLASMCSGGAASDFIIIVDVLD